MPTISQLPPSITVSAADEVPVSQAGAAKAVSVGALLASTQPAIIVGSPALIGRTSLGAGGPEQVDVGSGLSLSAGTLAATGSDHAAFPATTSLSNASDLVISDQGSPMLMKASLLRGLFSAGQNIVIDPNGTISATSLAVTSATVVAGGAISALPVVAALASQDLVAVTHSGSNCAIAYGNLLDGVTIDEAQVAAPASDTDTIWAAQGTNVMVRQSFSAIWTWIEAKLLTFKVPVVDVVTNTTLNASLHNARMLVCSQPVTLTPLSGNMGSGFQCTVVNASNGNVTLGSGFISSNGSLVLTPWQTASVLCISYSAGTINFATVSGNTPVAANTSAAVPVPGQVTSLSASGVTSTTINLMWQAPSGGGAVTSYIVQYRITGTSSWGTASPGGISTSYQLSALLPGTSYDIIVQGQNATGVATASAILTTATSMTATVTAPAQVTGVTATSVFSSAVQLTWSAQTGASAATSFTVQYRVSGSSSWITSAVGVTGTTATVSALQAATGYDFAVIGVNSSGVGLASSTVSATTTVSSNSVTSIAWNLVPTGTYVHGSGAVGVNAHVTPGTSPIHFGFSLSASTPPTGWTAALQVHTDLWGAYVPTPATAGSWYVWAEGLDGSAPTVSASPFLVQ